MSSHTVHLFPSIPTLDHNHSQQLNSSNMIFLFFPLLSSKLTSKNVIHIFFVNKRSWLWLWSWKHLLGLVRCSDDNAKKTRLACFDVMSMGSFTYVNQRQVKLL